jgi:SAM-dependent methyltransferase
MIVGLDVERRSPAVSVLGAATKLPLCDETFDVVVCCEVIEHVERPVLVMSELTRVLKPKGLLLLTFPFMFGLHETPRDFYRPTEFAVSLWLEELSLECERMLRRGGALTVLYTIVASFANGAVSWLVRSNRVTAPLGRVIDFIYGEDTPSFSTTSWPTGIADQYGAGLGVQGKRLIVRWDTVSCEARLNGRACVSRSDPSLGLGGAKRVKLASGHQ